MRVLARKLLLHFFPIRWPQKLARVDIPATTLERQHSILSIRAFSKPVVVKDGADTEDVHGTLGGDREESAECLSSTQ